MTGTKTADSARVAGKHGFSLISDEKFQEMYSLLLACRMLGERTPPAAAFELQPKHEAATAGVVACLRAGDAIPPTPQSVAARYLLTHSLTPADAVLAGATAQLAAATGEALRCKLEKKDHISVAFANSGETEPLRAIFATAARQSLPVLYVFGNDARLADVCGNIPLIRVDSADTVAVYRVAYESTTRAREGGGPTILQCAPWSENEPQDALLKLEQYLAEKGLFRKSWRRRLEAMHSVAMDRAAQAASRRFRDCVSGSAPEVTPQSPVAKSSSRRGGNTIA